MSGIIRQVAGVLVGIIICIVVITGVEMAGHALLSGALVFAAPLLAYLLAAAIGGYAAIRVAGIRRWWLPAFVTGFLALGTAMNLAAIDHPVWFGPAAAVALAAGYLASWRLTAIRGG